MYHLTVHPPSVVTAAVVSFDRNHQSLVVARGSWLEQWVIDSDDDQLRQKSKVNTLSTIRAIAPIKVAGIDEAPDHLVVTSDSGNFCVLGYDKGFIPVVNEPFGKSGIRRAVPGEYLAVDPRGRAVMVASVEKSRLVYVLNRDDSGEITVTSPIEAHCPDTILFELVAMDVGFANPSFVALEKSLASPNEMLLVCCELNLGLNTVFKKWSLSVPSTSSLLIALPGAEHEPSGLFVCSKNLIQYVNASGTIIAERKLDIDIQTAVVHKTKSIITLIQTTAGELISVTLSDDEILLSCFGLIPPSLFLAVFKAGYLWSASEYGDNNLYQFLNVDDLPSYPSDSISMSELENIVPVDDCTNCPSNLAPLTCSNIRDRQLTVGRGRSHVCQLTTIENGYEVETLVSLPLKAAPTNVFALKASRTDNYHSLMVLSLPLDTIVLGIDEEGSVSEVTSSKLSNEVVTLGVYQVGPEAVVQVHPGGLRHVLGSKVTKWAKPGARVVCCSANNSQLLLGLSSNKLVYFETDDDGMLIEYSQPLALSSPVLSVTVGEPTGSQNKSLYGAVACEDSTLRIISFDAKRPLKVLGLQTLAVNASSVLIVDSTLYIGLSNGVLVSGYISSDGTEIDADSLQTRVLGSQPVTITSFAGRIIAMSNTCWLLSSFTVMTPLLSTPGMLRLSCASAFSSEDIPLGVIAAHDNTFTVFTVDTAKQPLKHTNMALAPNSTPRAIVRNGVSPYRYVVGFDHASQSSTICVLSGSEIVDQVVIADGLATAAVNVRFDSRNAKEFLAVATQTSLYIYGYDGNSSRSKLQLVHSTEVSCQVLVPFRGMLLAGCKNTVILFDIGKKQLLRKSAIILSEFADIRTLATSQNRVFVGEARRNVAMLAYDNFNTSFVVVANYSCGYGSTCMLSLDPDTVCVGDKFGNLIVLRVPKNASLLCADADGLATLAARSATNKDPFLLELLHHFYVQDSITSLHKASLATIGGFDAIIYTGIQGSVGSLIPFVSSQEQDFMSKLQSAMQSRGPSILGRWHPAYRGYYAPVKDVVDGDICEQFNELSVDEQRELGESIDSTSLTVQKRLAEIRLRCVF